MEKTQRLMNLYYSSPLDENDANIQSFPAFKGLDLDRLFGPCAQNALRKRLCIYVCSSLQAVKNKLVYMRYK